MAFAALLCLGGAAFTVFVVTRDRSDDEGEIRSTVEKFALATDRGDQDAILGLVCEQEAAEIRDSEYFHEDRAGDYDTSVSEAPVTTSDITVTGDTAHATVSRPAGGEPATLYFRKEAGAWKVCAPAGDPLPSPSN